MFSRFLTIFSLVGLAFASIGEEYRSACQVIEEVISDASGVYYPGESRAIITVVRLELISEQATPNISKENIILPHLSQQDPACVVEPGTPEDVGKTVRSFRPVSPDITFRSR